MGKTFTVTRDGNLPPYVNSRITDEWVNQRLALEKHPQVGTWLNYSEWPEFLNESYTPNEPPTSETLTISQKKPVLRDVKFPIKVDVPTLWVKKEHLKDLMLLLRDGEAYQYNFLLDLVSVDFLNSPDENDLRKSGGKRFQVWYMLRSLKKPGMTMRVILAVDENEAAPSLTSLWVGANWPEREAFDMMGIVFEGHPDLHRIIMPDNYRGHPLRKDFPIKGIGEDYLIQDLIDEHLALD